MKEGYGFAMIREGAIIDEDLTTRPIAGVDWTLDTAVVYHKQLRPKTIPILVRKFKKRHGYGLSGRGSKKDSAKAGSSTAPIIGTSGGTPEIPVQLPLLR